MNLKIKPMNTDGDCALTIVAGYYKFYANTFMVWGGGPLELA